MNAIRLVCREMAALDMVEGCVIATHGGFPLHAEGGSPGVSLDLLAADDQFRQINVGEATEDDLVYSLRQGNRVTIVAMIPSPVALTSFCIALNGGASEAFIVQSKVTESLGRIRRALQEAWDASDSRVEKALEAHGAHFLLNGGPAILEGIRSQIDGLGALFLVDDEGFVLAQQGSGVDSMEQVSSAMSLTRHHLEGLVTHLRSGHLKFYQVNTLTNTLVLGRIFGDEVFFGAVLRESGEVGKLMLLTNMLARQVESRREHIETLKKPEKRRRRPQIIRRWERWATGGELVAQSRFLRSVSGKTFHRPDCDVAKRIRAENIRWIESRREALERGYAPCPKCGA